MPAREDPQRNLFDYSYYILIASFVILFFNAGARFSIGVVFKPMIAEFAWSRSAISLAVFINMAVFALSLTVVGRFYDRYGPKWVILISTFFASAGCIFLSRISSLGGFLIVYGIILAIGLGGTSATLVAALASKWFQRGRGLAISLALSGNCLGQFILIPLFDSLLVDFNWRLLFFGLGVIMLGVNTLLSLFVLKSDPIVPEGSLETVKTSSPHSSSLDLNLTQAMKTPSFWLFLTTMFVCGSGDFLISTHLIPFVTDHHIPSSTASQMFGWFGLLSFAGILVAGPISDRVGNKIPIALTFVLRALLFFLILQSQSVESLYIFALLFGFTFLVTAPLTTTLVARLYGLNHVGLISGFITTIHHLAGGFWAYLGGWIFDRTGSYRIAFFISLILAVVAVFSTLLIKEERCHPRGWRKGSETFKRDPDSNR